jgi:hypothetical protein
VNVVIPKRRRRPVVALCRDTGRPLGTFPSVVAAARHGHSEGDIHFVLNGVRSHHHGIVWRDQPKQEARLVAGQS